MRAPFLGLALLLSLSVPSGLRAGPERSPTDAPTIGAPGHIGPPGQVIGGTWKRFPPPAEVMRPAARMSSYAVRDPARDRMILFGGWGFEYFEDTWTFDLGPGGRWTPVAFGGVRPGPRLEHTTILDPVRNRMLLFGGKDEFSFLDDVWQLDLSGPPTWSPITPAGTPPSPRETRAVYDPVRDRMLIFGGYGWSYPGHLNETWALDLAGTPTWRQLAPTGPLPPARRGQSVIYDPVGDRLVVFGGYNDYQFMNDVWTLDLATLAWQRLVPTGDAPSARYGHTATYDPDHHEMMVFGGYGGGFLNDTYVLSLGAIPIWTRVSAPDGPLVRDFHSAIHDPARGRIVAFGGNAGRVYNDMWAFDTGARIWSRIDQPAAFPPAPRLSSYAVHDANSARMVLFGGWGFSYFDDTWTLALDQDPPEWKSVSVAHRPSARLEHTTVYDGTRDRMLLFGGKDSDQFFNDVWQLDLTGNPVWSRIRPAGTPPSERESRAVYDPIRDRMLIFGGFYPVHLNETWELDFTGTPTWRQLFPNGRLPAPRRGQSLIYDPVGDALVLFGGFDDRQFFNDVWLLRLRGQLVWTELPTTGDAPSPRYGHTATYDPVRRAMVVIGGYGGSFLDDAWVLPLDGARRWARIEADPHPGPTDFHTVIHDPDHDRFVLFGGNDGRPLGDLWELTLATPAAAPAPEPGGEPEPAAFALAATIRDPSSGIPIVRFTLPGRSPCRLELFDVMGRRLAERSLAAPESGEHRVSLDEAGSLRAGVYLIRLTQDQRSVVRRAVFGP